MRNLAKIFLMLLPLATACSFAEGEDWSAYAQAWLYGEPYYFYGEPYSLNHQPYFQEITSGFAEPFFFPQFGYSESLYYPYFGEEFFRWGRDPHNSSQQAIEAQRQKFEGSYYPFFGEAFFAKGEPQ